MQTESFPIQCGRISLNFAKCMLGAFVAAVSRLPWQYALLPEKARFAVAGGEFGEDLGVSIMFSTLDIRVKEDVSAADSNLSSQPGLYSVQGNRSAAKGDGIWQVKKRKLRVTKWVLRIPAYFKNGSAIPELTLNQVFYQIAKEFGEASIEGPERGIWIDSLGQVYDQPSYLVSVVREEEQLKTAKDLVAQIGKMLDQKAMYFEAGDGVVEVISGE
jgi:hypothetical protein